MSLDYPPTLPNPTRALHSPKRRVSESDIPGPASYSRRESDYAGTMDVEFFLNDIQAALFYSWWKDDLIYGGCWFNCSWPAMRPGRLVCQFKTEPVITHVFNGAYRYSAQVQVRGASEEVRGFDPLWGYVVLQMHFNNNLIDEKAHSFAADGTTFANPGRWAQAVDIGGTAVTGGGSNVVYSVSSSIDWYLDSGDFTIEGWVKNNATDNSRPRYLIRLSRAADDWDYIQVFINETGDMWGFSYPTGINSSVGLSGAAVATVGAYRHVALTRQGPVYRLFVDGVQQATVTNSYLRPSTPILCCIGNSRRSFVDALHGEIDDVRITKGIARYIANFSPPDAQFEQG